MIVLNGEKKVRIEAVDGYTHVFIDGKEIRRVREITYHQSVDEVPTVKLDVFANPSIEMDALVEVNYSEDEYLKWLDKAVEVSEEDAKIAFEICRARYLSYFGRPYDDIDNV